MAAIAVLHADAPSWDVTNYGEPISQIPPRYARGLIREVG